MSEDRTNKDPLLGGLDGMRAGQHWAGEPDSLKHTEGQQASAESDTAAADPAEKTEKNAESFSAKEHTAAPGTAGKDAEAFSGKEIQTAELEAQKIAQELRREAIKTGNTQKETEVPHAEPVKSQKKRSRKEEQQPSGGWLKEILEWVKIIVSAALIAFVLNTFIIANSEVPSGSMENTIMTGDRVIGSRLSYHFGDPKRGDIAIFRFPDNESIYYVKRIIGLPGETVDIIDGKVYIDGSDTPLDEPYIREPMIPEAPMHFEVPEGCYFMMGDNRNYSMDARRWENTYVKRDKIIAKVLFRYFPKPGMLK